MLQTPQPDWSFIHIALIGCLYFVYQGYINIRHKRLSKFGMDAIMYSIIKTFSSDKTVKNMDARIRKPELMQKTGKYALWVSIGFILVAVKWYFEYVLPFADK